ncbi:MAG: hypothetical protein LBE56_10965 [Tannerella sp.]|jgi:uncharacterized membrane protein|nr:hypothetical protein [Tannerella sp.]
MADLNKDAEDNKIMGVLAYLGILFLVPLLAAKDSPFARYHTNQGVILFIYSIVVTIVGMILGFIPFIGWIISLVLYLSVLVLLVIGVINAFQGATKPLPVIGNFTIIK